MIKINNLTKVKNNKKILDNINLELPSKGIVGVVGPNGAGKSSLFKILSGLYYKTFGNVEVDGIVSSAIENPELYLFLTGYNNLKIICDLYKINYEKINKVVDMFDMHSFIYKKVKNYSLGMKQRLYLSCAFLVDTNIIILDEPTNGLDPINIINLKKIIKQQENKLILYSTHNILDIDNFCDKVIFLDKGKIIRICSGTNNILSVFKEVYNVKE